MIIGIIDQNYKECDRFISKIDLEREYDPYDGERYELGRRFAEYENEIEQMKLRDCKEKEEKKLMKLTLIVL